MFNSKTAELLSHHQVEIKQSFPKEGWVKYPSCILSGSRSSVLNRQTWLVVGVPGGWRKTPKRFCSRCTSAWSARVKNSPSSTSTSQILKVMKAHLSASENLLQRLKFPMAWFSFSHRSDEPKRDHPCLGQRDGRAPLQRHRYSRAEVVFPFVCRCLLILTLLFSLVGPANTVNGGTSH